MKRVLYVLGYIFGAIAFVGCAYLLTTVLTLERRLTTGAIESTIGQSFYVLPDTLPKDEPGNLIKYEKLNSVPNGMNGWRILYYSTDLNGNSIVVSGLVAAPQNDSSVKHDIVSWGHPTTGIAERCAPSVGIDPFDSIEGLRNFVQDGYIVAATDYSGMGMSGPPSFLIGQMEGQNVLDAARAARQLPVNATNNVILWGHSQGGHAALFAEQLSSSYAPELSIKGVALAAPATELGELLEANVDAASDITIGSYVMESYSKTYGADINTLLTPAGAEATHTLADYCLLGQNAEMKKIADPLLKNYFAHNPVSTEPWGNLLKQNTPGQQKINAPIFIAQGEKDTLISPSITRSFANKQSSFGTPVTYHSIQNATHGTVALDAMPFVMTWVNQLSK